MYVNGVKTQKHSGKWEGILYYRQLKASDIDYTRCLIDIDDFHSVV